MVVVSVVEVKETLGINNPPSVLVISKIEEASGLEVFMPICDDAQTVMERHRVVKYLKGFMLILLDLSLINVYISNGSLKPNIDELTIFCDEICYFRDEFFKD